MAQGRTGAGLTLDTLRQGTTDPRAVETHYDGWADSYDATLAQWRYRTPEEVAALMVAHLPPASPAPGGVLRVLDVGCGTGLFGQALAAEMQADRRGGDRDAAAGEGPDREGADWRGVVLDGLDISAASLERAAERGVYDRLLRQDLQALPLPLPDDSHDGAAIVGVLTYIPDAEALLRDLCRVVRTGGVIAFTQRSDLWEPRGFPALIARLEAEGTWRRLHISPPRPYLPENADFADEIGVIQTLCRVA